MVNTETALDISAATYAKSPTTATARAPHRRPTLRPFSSLSQSRVAATTLGSARYRPNVSKCHTLSGRTSTIATWPKPVGRTPRATATTYSPDECAQTATTAFRRTGSETLPATVGMSGRYTSTTVTASTCVAATHR